jgi:dolichol-phosphate mannosyltransferase
VDEIVRIRERNRFFRYLVAWVGFRQTGIPYVASKRHAGQTKFAKRKLLALAVDALTSFSSAPLRLCTGAGFLVAAACVPYTLWAIYVRLFTDRYVPGWPAIIVAVLFLGAVQLISLGILGEYIGRIYDEVKGRPIYIAQERVGFGRFDERSGSDRALSDHGRHAELDSALPAEDERLAVRI